MKNCDKIAAWAVTSAGANLAEKIAGKQSCFDLFFKESLPCENDTVFQFENLKQAVAACFCDYSAHIFIMSAGIAVRMIAPLIRSKTEDPAVLAVDEKGIHVISLLSGHIGGANALAIRVAESIGAVPVITTATDLNSVPAIDVIAVKKGLIIENPDAIKYVSMALIEGKPVFVHDPYEYLSGELSGAPIVKKNDGITAGVFIDDVLADLPEKTLVLRPSSLAVGIGCNRNTGADELRAFFREVMERFSLAEKSVKCLASIEAKSDEKGLLELAGELSLPVLFFRKMKLTR